MRTEPCPNCSTLLLLDEELIACARCGALMEVLTFDPPVLASDSSALKLIPEAPPDGGADMRRPFPRQDVHSPKVLGGHVGHDGDFIKPDVEPEAGDAVGIKFMQEKSSGCFIDVWRDVNFKGEVIRIYGPAEHPYLRFDQGDWGDDIGSLRVGPNGFVVAYRDKYFRDELVTFGPNEEIADLRELKFHDDIDSVKVIDSLKIFDCLIYNSKGEGEVAGANSAKGGPGGGKSKRKRHKGKRG